MLDFNDFFDPLGKDFKPNQFAEGSIGKICLANNKLRTDSQVQIALFGVSESRNAFFGEFDSGLNTIRKYFYNLTNIGRISITDLGNLKPGKTVKDTYVSIQLIITELLNRDIIPLIFGGSQELSVFMLRALSSKINDVGYSVVDAKIDAEDDDFHSQSFIHHVEAEFKEKCTVSVIGYQSYFVGELILNKAKENFWNLYRLGAVRNSFTQIEPVFRDSDIVTFDVSAIRQTDFPAATYNSPNGFYAEEACQIANLAGLSDRLKIFSISEYQNDNDINGQSAHLLAQIMWHFLYGYAQRKGDYPNQKLDVYKKIYVKIENMDADLVFYENRQNKRFWVEIPIDSKLNTKVIACSELDYQNACNNEIPDRIWKNISRYLK